MKMKLSYYHHIAALCALMRLNQAYYYKKPQNENRLGDSIDVVTTAGLLSDTTEDQFFTTTTTTTTTATSRATTTETTMTSDSTVEPLYNFHLSRESLLRLFHRLLTDLEYNLDGLKRAFADCCLECPQNYTLLGPGPACYKISTNALPWQQARNTCREEGGDLVGYETQFEEYLVNELISNHEGRPIIRFYTSGNELEQSGTWKWGTGLSAAEFTYTNWAPGEPNEDQTEEEDCVEVIVGRGWNDVPCYLPFRYICEHKPILKA